MGSFVSFKKLRNWDAFCQLKSKKNAEKKFFFFFFYIMFLHPKKNYWETFTQTYF